MWQAHDPYLYKVHLVVPHVNHLASETSADEIKKTVEGVEGVEETETIEDLPADDSLTQTRLNL